MNRPAASSDAAEASQADILREIAELHARYQQLRDGGGAAQRRGMA